MTKFFINLTQRHPLGFTVGQRSFLFHLNDCNAFYKKVLLRKKYDLRTAAKANLPSGRLVQFLIKVQVLKQTHLLSFKQQDHHLGSICNKLDKNIMSV